MIEFDSNTTNEDLEKSKTQLLFENISQLSTAIDYLKNNRTTDYIMKNDPDDYRKYCTLQNQIIFALIDHIKSTKSKFNFDTIIGFPPCEQFWIQIKHIVESETSMFLDAISIRSLDTNKRHEIYKQIFTYIYIDRENHIYISDQLNINNDDILTIEKIFNKCEDIIILRMYSKRRFKNIISDYVGLEEDDVNFLWELFSNNKDLLNKIAIFNKINILELKVNSIFDNLDKLSNANNGLVEQFIKFIDEFSKQSFDNNVLH